MWRHYFTPTSLPEVLDLLAHHGSRARVIAGGTDLLLEIERGARPHIETLIDITRIPNLDQITLDGEMITLGPLVTHNHVVASDLIAERGLPLLLACWEVGAPQIRNRGTVAGNIITASPANDTVTALKALDAEVYLQSQSGERWLKLADFFTGYRQTVLQPDELLTAIRFPTLKATQAGVFLKLGLRRAQAISVLDLAAVLTFAEQGNRQSLIVAAKITVGCVAPTIINLTDVEAFLVGRVLSDETLKEAGRLAMSGAAPIGDVRGPAEYRIEMLRVYTERALRLLRDGAEATRRVSNPAMLWGENEAHVQAALPALVHHERDSADTITTTVNGQTMTATGGAHKTLLRFLREDLKMLGTKEGCAEGECGACTVYLDDVAVMACMVPAPRAHGAEIMTVEGLARDGELHPLQQSFIEAGAVQCGFCTPGFLMAGAKLLDEKPAACREQVEQSISGNLCRCTGYYKILEAFTLAQRQLEEES